MPAVNVFFDMDGVLVEYVDDGYKGDNPIFEQRGQHWFARQHADPRAIALARHVSCEPYAHVHVCSSISEPPTRSLGREQYDDKRDWLRRHLECVCVVDSAIIGARPKEQMAEMSLERDLTTTDVLIDDYNINLVRWESAGGRAIKYLNGINDAGSWSGDVLDPDYMSLDDMLTRIIRAAR